MKKIFLITFLIIGFAINALADDNVRVSNIYYHENSVGVELVMTQSAKAKYKIVYFKVVPSKGISGIIEGVKYGSIQYDTSNSTVYFECEEGKAKQCKAYDFEVITTETRSH